MQTNPPALSSPSANAPSDPIRISLHSSRKVNDWCQNLNCTETCRRNAVLAVSPLAAYVRAYLSR